MIYIEPTLSDHLFEIAVAEGVSAVPADAQEDDFGFKVPPLEGGGVVLHEPDSV